ncbi:OmpA family protein [Vibrio sp. RC27]
MKKLAVGIAAALMMSSSAMAEVYVGAKAGSTWTNDACIVGGACDDDSNGYGAFLGYQAWENVALELGYDDLGKFTGEGMDDEKVKAITFAPKFAIPVADKFDVYGKLGGAWVEYGDEDDMSILGAFGFDVHATDNLSVRLEYQTLTDVNNDIVRAEVNATTIGLLYKFGGSEPAVAAPIVAEEVAPVVAAPVVEAPMVKEVEPKILSMQLDTSSSFAVNSAVLSDAGKAEVAKVAMVLSKHEEAVVSITGHTDSTGSEEYNQTLSEARAQAVADEIISAGIDASRVTAMGKGELEPVADNETVEGREMNRRVEIDVPSFDYEEMVK